MRVEYTTDGWRVKPVGADSKALAKAMEAVKPLADLADSPMHAEAKTLSESAAALIEYFATGKEPADVAEVEKPY